MDDPFIGKLIEGKYSVEEKLGEGRAGVVYRAKHNFIGIMVAIRIFNYQSSDPTLLESLKREARATASIQHPNISQVIDFGLTEDNSFYIVTEYFKGRTLLDRMRTGGILSLKEAARIITQVCEALDVANRKGFLHQALNPRNILLQTDYGAGVVKVLDFGIPKSISQLSLTQAGETTGDPEYLSPEQCMGNRLDERAEVYSLATILFQMLTGRTPFTGGTPLSVINKHISEPPPGLRQLRPDIPQAVETAIMKALSKNPNDRQQSVIQFSEELSQANYRDSLGAITGSFSPVSKSAQTGDLAMPGQAMPSDDSESTKAITGKLRPPTPSSPMAPAAPPKPMAPAAPARPISPPPIVRAGPSMQPAPPVDSPKSSRMPAAPNVAGPAPESRPRQSLLEKISNIPSAIFKRLRKEETPEKEATISDSLSLEKEAFIKSEMQRPTVLDRSTVRRHTDVSFPSRIPLGKTHNLRVQIVPAEEISSTGEVKDLPKPHAYDATLELKAPGPEEPPIRLTVSVAAENFELESETQTEIVVPMTGRSAAAIFRLRGESVGPGRIMVDFSQDGAPVGSVDLFPEVVGAQQTQSLEAAMGKGEVSINAGHRAAPDAVIKVYVSHFGDQPGRLHFVLYSTDPRLKDLPVFDGDLGTQDLRSEVATWVENQLRSLGSIARQSDSTMEEVIKILSDIGCNLYDQILPKGLQEICWILRKRGVRSLMILSDEPHIPWELIKPYRTDPATGEFETDDFWGESFALTHWLRGRPPVGRLSLNRIFAVASSGDSSSIETVRDFLPDPEPADPERQSPLTSGGGGLKSVNEELDFLRSLESHGARVNVLPARKRDLREAFESGHFDLLHLAVHGNFMGVNSADASAVLMEDGPFTAAELSPRIAGAIREASPLIFFNACQTGRVGFSLTRLGSWSARLIELGCGGFIGSLWPVTDRAALAFARAFYDALLHGTTIGEAVLQARLSVRQLYPSDPTWLAYCCFADPMAKMEK